METDQQNLAHLTHEYNWFRCK